MEQFSNLPSFVGRYKHGLKVRTVSLSSTKFNPAQTYQQILAILEETDKLGTDILLFGGHTWEASNLAFASQNSFLRMEVQYFNDLLLKKSTDYKALTIICPFLDEYGQSSVNVFQAGKKYRLTEKNGIFFTQVLLYQVDGTVRNKVNIAVLLDENLDNPLVLNELVVAKPQIIFASKLVNRLAALDCYQNSTDEIIADLHNLTKMTKAYVVFASPSSASSAGDNVAQAIHWHGLYKDIAFSKFENNLDNERVIMDSWLDLNKQKALIRSFVKTRVALPIELSARYDRADTIQKDIFASEFLPQFEESSLPQNLPGQEATCSSKIYPHAGIDLAITEYPFFPRENTKERAERAEEILSIAALGLAKRMQRTKIKNLVLGLSGGLDSCLTTMIALRALKILGYSPSNLLLFTMPGFGTSAKTLANVKKLVEALSLQIETISITDAVLAHFQQIKHDPLVKDATYENSQARERTQILMDIANQQSALVLGTGDASELALGWCTYNGDHMSMYATNAGIPKTSISPILEYEGKRLEQEYPLLAEVLHNIIETPISPELLPLDEQGQMQQKTEDKLGDYRLHDFFLYYHLLWQSSPEEILFYAEQVFVKKGIYTWEIVYRTLEIFYHRFYSQQYKRSCAPEGASVQDWSLSPRSSYLFPADLTGEYFLSELAKIYEKHIPNDAKKQD